MQGGVRFRECQAISSSACKGLLFRSGRFGSSERGGCDSVHWFGVRQPTCRMAHDLLCCMLQGNHFVGSVIMAYSSSPARPPANKTRRRMREALAILVVVL